MFLASMLRRRGSPKATPNAPPEVPEAFAAAVGAAHALLEVRRNKRKDPMDWARRPATAGLRELMVALARPRQWEHLTYTLRHETAELEPVTIANLFFAEEPVRGERIRVFDGCYGRTLPDDAHLPLDPARHIIFANPWSRSRLLDTLTYIGGPGRPWARDPLNHRVQLLDPFGIALVRGGNHSITTGILRGDLALAADAYVDLRSWVMGLRCDGVRVTRAEDGRVVGRVVDPVFGALLEIARLYVEWEREELGRNAAP